MRSICNLQFSFFNTSDSSLFDERIENCKLKISNCKLDADRLRVYSWDLPQGPEHAVAGQAEMLAHFGAGIFGIARDEGFIDRHVRPVGRVAPLQARRHFIE